MKGDTQGSRDVSQRNHPLSQTLFKSQGPREPMPEELLSTHCKDCLPSFYSFMQKRTLGQGKKKLQRLKSSTWQRETWVLSLGSELCLPNTGHSHRSPEKPESLRDLGEVPLGIPGNDGLRWVGERVGSWHGRWWPKQTNKQTEFSERPLL